MVSTSEVPRRDPNRVSSDTYARTVRAQLRHTFLSKLYKIAISHAILDATIKWSVEKASAWHERTRAISFDFFALDFTEGFNKTSGGVLFDFHVFYVKIWKLKKKMSYIKEKERDVSFICARVRVLCTYDIVRLNRLSIHSVLFYEQNI